MRYPIPVLAISSAILSMTQACRASAPATSGQNVLTPQQGVGAQFGSRDPYTCSSKTAPVSGAITPGYARQYFICGFEKVDSNGSLFLAENVKVQVGAGVVPRGTYTAPRADQDPNAKVYAIRGSYDQYICNKINKGYTWGGQLQDANQGKNCAVWHMTNATGDCYRTTFGDWKCYMTDLDAQQIPGQPAPKD